MKRAVALPECEAFMRELHPRLIGGLTLYCGQAALAEELTQETLARVWGRWSEVRNHPAPHAWAWRVALNLASSWFRRKAIERRATARLGPPASLSFDPDVADRVAVREAVAALPTRQRAVLVLRYFEDLSVAETAEAMGCAQGTVKSMTHQAIAALRGHLGHTIELTIEPTEEVSNHA
jgi:RNA polymerase sigma-70 factor (sigma-E family)